MIELVRIPKENVNDAWGMVSDNVADALSRNQYCTSDHIKQWILNNEMQLWILWDSKDKKYYGVVITEIIQRPLQRCLNIKIMTGNHREKWQHLIKQVEDFAWQNNCDLLELVARPGWKRVLKPFGFKESHVLLEKHNKEKK